MPSFSALLTDFNLILLGLAAAYVAGVVTSQRVKDTISGLPSRARVALKASENDVRARLKAAEDDVLSKLPGVAPVKVPAPAGTPLSVLNLTPAMELKAPIVTAEKVALPPAPSDQTTVLPAPPPAAPIT